MVHPYTADIRLGQRQTQFSIIVAFEPSILTPKIINEVYVLDSNHLVYYSQSCHKSRQPRHPFHNQTGRNEQPNPSKAG